MFSQAERFARRYLADTAEKTVRGIYKWQS